jgi:acyl-CoA thioesterase-2
MVSFHAEEEGAFDHQDKMPDVPPPENSPPRRRRQPMFREMPEFIRRHESDRPIEPSGRTTLFRPESDDGRIMLDPYRGQTA